MAEFSWVTISLGVPAGTKIASQEIDSNPGYCDAMVGIPGSTSLGSMPVMASARRSEEHTAELHSLVRISYAVFCLKKNIPDRKTTRKYQLTSLMSILYIVYYINQH